MQLLVCAREWLSRLGISCKCNCGFRARAAVAAWNQLQMQLLFVLGRAFAARLVARNVHWRRDWPARDARKAVGAPRTARAPDAWGARRAEDAERTSTPAVFAPLYAEGQPIKNIKDYSRLDLAEQTGQINIRVSW
jgi:hypothetical protein